MSAILPGGKRAVAIKIDNGGDFRPADLFLPNDRVDVVRLARDEDATKARGVEIMTAQTILANAPAVSWRSARTSKSKTAKRSSPAPTRRLSSIRIRST